MQVPGRAFIANNNQIAFGVHAGLSVPYFLSEASFLPGTNDRAESTKEHSEWGGLAAYRGRLRRSSTVIPYGRARGGGRAE